MRTLLILLEELFYKKLIFVTGLSGAKFKPTTPLVKNAYVQLNTAI